MQAEPYREVPLYRRDGSVAAVALLDLEDYKRLGRHRWCLSTWGYAVRNIPRPTRGQIKMHREVLGLVAGDGKIVDHINGDKLDNRRSNLRIVTNAENMQNREGGYGASRFRGVSAHQPTGKWRARVRVNGEEHRLGLFDSEADAARAAAEGRRRLMTHAQN